MILQRLSAVIFNNVPGRKTGRNKPQLLVLALVEQGEGRERERELVLAQSFLFADKSGYRMCLCLEALAVKLAQSRQSALLCVICFSN